jgi:DNA-binding beta-propeller fold protein YncE
MKWRLAGAVAFLALLATNAGAQPVPAAIPIPGGDTGVGFDDLRFSASLGRLLVPAGGTGSLVLVSPGSWSITQIGGFSEPKALSAGHDDGVTSVDEGRGFLFVTDRTALRLSVVDPANGHVVSGAKLAAGPDYVRYVEPTGEIWVTEPDKERIEIFRLEGNPPRPVHDDFIDVAGGPESLVIDVARSRAYAHLWKGKTVAISLKNRGILATWPNGCEGSRGIAFDAERNLIFVGCSEGRAVTLDAKSGKILGKTDVGSGIDLIDYNPRLAHLYLAGGKSGTLGIVAVLPNGGLSLIAELPTVKGGHCVVADASDRVYVCDPTSGRILVIRDAGATDGTRQ